MSATVKHFQRTYKGIINTRPILNSNFKVITMSQDASATGSAELPKIYEFKTLDEIRPGDRIYTRNRGLPKIRDFMGLGNETSHGSKKTRDEWKSLRHSELVLKKNEDSVTTVLLTTFHGSEKLADHAQIKLDKSKWKYLIPVSPTEIESEEQKFAITMNDESKRPSNALSIWVNVIKTTNHTPSPHDNMVCTVSLLNPF